mmetsp:Transcript_70478/g.201878  ORF Transcript_70478/g.201878 Transcript_70478/m.201878 type:complete len:239 (-) Transcript_70478:177-893(-)
MRRDLETGSAERLGVRDALLAPRQLLPEPLPRRSGEGPVQHLGQALDKLQEVRRRDHTRVLRVERPTESKDGALVHEQHRRHLALQRRGLRERRRMPPLSVGEGDQQFEEGDGARTVAVDGREELIEAPGMQQGHLSIAAGRRGTNALEASHELVCGEELVPVPVIGEEKPNQRFVQRRRPVVLLDEEGEPLEGGGHPGLAELGGRGEVRELVQDGAQRRGLLAKERSCNLFSLALLK